MSVADAAPYPRAMNGVVCCPTCGLAATVEGRFRLRGTGEPVGRVLISCIEGHGWLLLADRVRPVTLGGDPDALEGQVEAGLAG